MKAGYKPRPFPGAPSEASYRKAIDDWNQVITPKTRDFDALAHRGNVFLLLGEYSKADSDLSESIKLNKLDFGTFNSRGHARVRMYRLKEAVRDFKVATDLAPRYAPAWCTLGRSLRLLGERDRARQALLRCRELAPGTLLQQQADDQLNQLP